MTAVLQVFASTATAWSVQVRIVSFFMALAILFGSVAGTASAHADDLIASHGNELFTVLEHTGDAGLEDRHKQTGEAPCHVVSHHHCSTALGADAPSLNLAMMLPSASYMPRAVSAMASLSQAPPTEPPSA